MIRTETRTARKTHICCTKAYRCPGVIRPGERYLEHVASPGGDLGLTGWGRLAECAPCAETYGRPIAPAAVEAKRCHNCGRIGTREFVPYPAQNLAEIAVRAGEWGWECANKTACRKRWPKTRDEVAADGGESR
jgi:hypothetical protein